jgi:uncharacterized protein
MTEQIDRARNEADTSGAELIREYITAMNERDVARIATLWAHDGVLEYPFSPEQLADVIPRRLDGGERIVAWFRSVLPMGEAIRGCVDAIRPLEEQDVFLVEYHERSDMASGKVFEAHFCAIVRIREGKLVHWREFFDPSLVQAAFGDADHQK